MTGKSSQAKGRRGEIELAEYLREYGYPARPGAPLSFGTEPDVVGVDGLHIECKRHEKIELEKWYSQAVHDAEQMQDGRPVVIFRKNRGQWIIALALSDFLEIMEGRDQS